MSTEKVYTVVEMDGNYIESFEVFHDHVRAMKYFKEYLKASEVRLRERRIALARHFWEGDGRQLQMFSKDVK